MNQRNDVRIEDEGEDKNEETEMEADKENTAPTTKSSKNSKRIQRYRSKRQSIKKQKKDIATSQEEIRNVVTNVFDQKESSDPSVVTVLSVCKSLNQEMIVKQESIDSESMYSQNRKSVETPGEDLPQISVENSRSEFLNDFGTSQQQTEMFCVNTTSGDRMESNVESDSTLAETSSINVNGFSLVEIDSDAKAAITLIVQSDSPVLEETEQQEKTSMHSEASCENKRERKNIIKISQLKNIFKVSQLMTEEQKDSIETSYRINVSLMKYEVQNKMTVLSKENIKCNICGANYSRLDKCKVSISRVYETFLKHLLTLCDCISSLLIRHPICFDILSVSIISLIILRVV